MTREKQVLEQRFKMYLKYLKSGWHRMAEDELAYMSKFAKENDLKVEIKNGEILITP